MQPCLRWILVLRIGIAERPLCAIFLVSYSTRTQFGSKMIHPSCLDSRSPLFLLKPSARPSLPEAPPSLIASCTFNMRTVLHIFDSKARPYDAAVLHEQMKLPECSVELFDLSQPTPDYDALLDKIFSADCVDVW